MRVAVAMSGGIDSLRAAVLLKEMGFSVTGIHMRLALPDGESIEKGETLKRRKERLPTLAAEFSIPLTVLDMRREFEDRVIQPFVKAYRTGLTPNPCILCNTEMKFGILLQVALKMGMDCFATGHYARVLPPEAPSDRFRLLRGTDPSKDQSYFLCGLTQAQLARAVFPLGSQTKSETLEWAATAGLSSSLKEESQEICFIPTGNYQEFLMGKLHLDSDTQKGPILDAHGNRLGEHKGVFAYTVGQRRGLGISSPAPYYVLGIDPIANSVTVGRDQDLYCREFQVGQANWVSVPPPPSAFRGQVRIRNQHFPASAEIVPMGDVGAIVTFDEPQRAVTPGQVAVFYDGDLVLGGGVIRRR